MRPCALLAFRDYTHYFATPSMARKPLLSTAYSPDGIKTEKDRGQWRVRIVAIRPGKNHDEMGDFSTFASYFQRLGQQPDYIFGENGN